MRELLKSPGARDADAADTATADKAFFKVCDAQYVESSRVHEITCPGACLNIVFFAVVSNNMLAPIFASPM